VLSVQRSWPACALNTGLHTVHSRDTFAEMNRSVVHGCWVLASEMRWQISSDVSRARLNNPLMCFLIVCVIMTRCFAAPSPVYMLSRLKCVQQLDAPVFK
jgi:hypothetical protein